MSNTIKILGLIVSSIIFTEAITVVLIYIKYISGSNQFSPAWVGVVPLVTATISGLMSFSLAKIIKFQKAMEVGFFLAILWLVLLYSSNFYSK